MTRYYSPHTGEIIITEQPADWMGQTDIEPPAFDAQLQGAFFSAGAWELRQAHAAPGPTYAERRAAEYPPMTDYIDGIVKGDADQVQAYVAACLAVKAKYPK